MTVIKGYAEMLADELDEDDAERATLISSAASRLLNVSESAQQIEKNRDFPDELAPLDIVPMVERIVSECKMRYSDGSITVVTPETAIAETLPRIETAVFELIDNAARHDGDPASIEVEVAVSDLRVIVRVSDSGPGLPKLERAVLETGEETPLIHGQGLGLWLSYWIVRTIDGDIEVTECKQGTTIEVRLPAPV